MVRMVCTGCETRHCEMITNKPYKEKWEPICWLMNPEEGPMPAEWREKKSRGD